MTEIVKEDEKLKIFAKQFMERVDEENNAKPLILKWVQDNKVIVNSILMNIDQMTNDLWKVQKIKLIEGDALLQCVRISQLILSSHPSFKTSGYRVSHFY